MMTINSTVVRYFLSKMGGPRSWQIERSILDSSSMEAEYRATF